MISVRRVSSETRNTANKIGLYLFLKNTFVGKIYLNKLRRYTIIRKIVLWTWPKFLLTYLTITFFFKKVRNSKPLLNISDCQYKQSLYPKELVQVFPADFYPSSKRSTNIQEVYEFPEIFVTTIDNCTVRGGSNFIWSEKGVYSQNLFRCQHDYTSEELHGHFFINTKKSLVTTLSNLKTKTEVESGALFTDAVSINYAHFLTEVLPRIFAYFNYDAKPKIPLIIDYGLHTNLMQALDIVVGTDTDIIGLEIGEPLNVKSLQVVSSCGYVPFQRRPHSESLNDHSEGVFSSSVLSSMCDFIKSKISVNNNVIKSKKIFIKRNATYRNLQNSSAIEQKLIAHGFVIVEPEKLNFLEQVFIFSNAEIIIGATGAAFANLIFCSSNTKIIILIADLEQMIYGYWQNMASAVGNRVTYIVGKTKDSNFHSDYHIDIDTMMCLLPD